MIIRCVVRSVKCYSCSRVCSGRYCLSGLDYLDDEKHDVHNKQHNRKEAEYL